MKKALHETPLITYDDFIYLALLVMHGNMTKMSLVETTVNETEVIPAMSQAMTLFVGNPVEREQTGLDRPLHGDRKESCSCNSYFWIFHLCIDKKLAYDE